MEKIKCVVVGDGAVGKTCMILSYVNGKFPDQYIPTIMESYHKQTYVDGQTVNFEIVDTAGQDEYDNMRRLAYPKTDVFIICYSISSSTSYDSARTKWHPEIMHHQPGAPIILVATKGDLRTNKDAQNKLIEKGIFLIQEEAGESMRKSINAKNQMECSALTLTGLNKVFEAVVRAKGQNTGRY